MSEVVDGLGDAQSVITTAYAASLLPEPYRTAWEASRDALRGYYDERDVMPLAWDVCATPAMKRYYGNIKHFLKECAAASAKGYSDKRLAVEVQNGYRHYSDFNIMSDVEKSWFIDLKSCYRWRLFPRKLTKMLGHMGPIMWIMTDADRLEDFDLKLRSVTREWLVLALSEAE
ncbi:hypothetical protein [Brevundimonas sp.]|uniref:hypothetical protein n=1 Tax=Brevundimonas sp. TaxID=1871086 RepID=UPI0039E21726